MNVFICKFIGKINLDRIQDGGVGGRAVISSFENSKITGVYLSSNELTLKKHLYEICPEDIKVVGDYVLLNVAKKEVIKEEEPKEVLDVEIVNPEELEDED